VILGLLIEVHRCRYIYGVGQIEAHSSSLLRAILEDRANSSCTREGEEYEAQKDGIKANGGH